MQKKSLLSLTSLLLSSVVSAVTFDTQALNSSIVLYNSNIALVHEERNINIKKRDKELIFKDVAPTIISNSVNIRLSPSVKIYSQRYNYDKLNLQTLLKAYVGETVSLQLRNKEKIIQGKLLTSTNPPLFQKEDGSILSVNGSDIIFNKLPKSLHLTPSLVWEIATDKNLHTRVSLDYLLSNINYKSSYIVDINNESASFNGSIKITNNSGKDFYESTLSFVTGDINRVSFTQNPRVTTLYKAAPRVVKQKAVEGYYLYNVPFKVTLKNHESKEIKFLSRRNLPISREYRVDLTNPYRVQGESSLNATQYIHLPPLKEAIPRGVVRTYTKTENGTILLGESSIEHTGKKQPIVLKIGKNFDLKVTESLLKQSDTTSSLHREISYSISNNSKSIKELTLCIPFNTKEGSKVITQEKYRFTKGNFVTFSLQVRANATKNFNVIYESKK